jgi:hypothetical protein
MHLQIQEWSRKLTLEQTDYQNSFYLPFHRKHQAILDIRPSTKSHQPLLLEDGWYIIQLPHFLFPEATST